MPIFDYKCPKCGHQENDVYQKKMEPMKCPKCSTKMGRIYNGHLGFNANKLKMDREHSTWVESKSQRLSKKEV